MFLSGIEPHTDTAVLHDVRARIDRAAELEGHAIDVSCDNGVVTLRGAVSSEEQRAEAERVAFDVRGVFDVLNRLRVEPSHVEHVASHEAQEPHEPPSRESTPAHASEADTNVASEPAPADEPREDIAPEAPPSIH